MKLKHIIAIAAVGIAAPALAQSTPMSGPNAPGAGMHPSSPQTGGAGAMSSGRGGNASGGGMHPNDPIGSGDDVVSHHGTDGRGMNDRGMQSRDHSMGDHGMGDHGMGMDHRDGMRHGHCRAVYRHHHRVRRCM